ncbi:MAG TPA: hypothetical protein VIL55_13710 [Naasia sp.]
MDDDPSVRDSYQMQVEYADLTPVNLAGDLGTLRDFLRRDIGADAGVSDFQLFPSGYAQFNGAELVAAWYARGFPAVLCTRYEKAQIEAIRPYRRRIPVMMTPDQLNPSSLLSSLELSLRELQGEFVESRRPRRTQVHFVRKDEFGKDAFEVEIPAWSTKEMIRVVSNGLPDDVLAGAHRGDYRCFAGVNLNADNSEDLYLDWDLR